MTWICPCFSEGYTFYWVKHIYKIVRREKKKVHAQDRPIGFLSKKQKQASKDR